MGNWKREKLGGLLELRTERNINRETSLVLTVSKTKGVIPQSENFSRGRILASRNTEEYRVVRQGDYAYNPARINVGSIARLKDYDSGIISPMYVCFATNANLSGDYLEHFLRTKYFSDAVKRRLSGSVRECLNYSGLCDIDIQYPADLAEQSRIADVLSAADEAVSVCRAVAEKLAAVQAGLMQDLLKNGTPEKLKRVGLISVSGVDKHVRQGEIPIRLCNYTNVYNNRYITDVLPFSKGSVTPSEFKRFSLRDGDVLFTKDSENPDDIGIPSVVCGNPEGLVCGYHLARLRPHKGQYDGRFVMFALQAQACANYFGAMANGITRFGMTINTLENQTIRLPDTIDEQRHIAEILASVDRRLAAEKARLSKLEDIKRGLMDDLLTNRVNTDNL